MESVTEVTSVQREIPIDASPETVWEFLVDPVKMTRWMGLEATLEPQPGGVYLVEVIGGHVARGEVVEVEPPRRLVFTFGWDPGEDGPSAVPPGSSTIEIELDAAPDGDGTVLRFTHDLSTVEAATQHAHGWDHYLSRLATAAGGGQPGADPWLTGEM
jgi:uncharacterized protein YndB with AHSA1/START domain